MFGLDIYDALISSHYLADTKHLYWIPIAIPANTHAKILEAQNYVKPATENPLSKALLIILSTQVYLPNARPD